MAIISALMAYGIFCVFVYWLIHAVPDTFKSKGVENIMVPFLIFLVIIAFPAAFFILNED